MENYWTEIKNQLKLYEDKVFFLPLDDFYLKNIEKKIGLNFPKIYFEFLKEFGFTQDFITEINQTEDSLKEDLEYVDDLCPEFFPIGTCEENDEVWMIKRDSSDDTIFVIPMDDEEEIVPESKGYTFKHLINNSLTKVQQEYHTRTKNAYKVRICEFRIKTENFNIIIEMLNEKLSTKWLNNNWKDKYNPNVFDIEIALFEIDNKEIIVEREEDDGVMVYYFEIEESITEMKKLNKSLLIKDIFNLNNIEYEFTDYGIIEIEE